jgi:hypothetical protein
MGIKITFSKTVLVTVVDIDKGNVMEPNNFKVALRMNNEKIVLLLC